MRKKAISFGLLACLLSFVPVGASASVPDWLREAAQQPAKHYAPDVSTVILLSDRETTVKDNGEMITRVRTVVRVLRPDGRYEAYQSVPFSDETHVNYIKGWSISSKGQEYEAKKDDVVELAPEDGSIYSDEKLKAIRIRGVDVGTVIGVEWEQKKSPYTFEEQWHFQREAPVVRARYTLHLPPGWEYRATWINYSEQTPVVLSTTSTWGISDIPRIEDEYHMPTWEAIAGRLVVTFFSQETKARAFQNWSDFGAWYSRLTAGVRQPSPELEAKVQELAPAGKPLVDRIRALARFAQSDVRYAAIEIGIGGYLPHPASQVFKNRYGDCKDKATVLSTMLAQIGVKSYYILLHDDRGIFTEKTPPNMGFNHVILAVQIEDPALAKSLTATYEHPKLGHLVIFDPTNTWVPFGEIPFYEQGSYGLLVTQDNGELIRFPLSSPEANRIQRTAKFKLLPDGTLQGEIEEVRSGYMAMLYREYMHNESQHDRRKTLEYILGENLSNFQVDSFDMENGADIGKDLVLRYKFTATHYAKNVGPLLLVRPRVVGEMMGEFDATKPRHYDYEFSAPFLRSDTVEISLPDGYTVDELPDPAKAVFPFAEYTSKAEKDGNILKYSRQYKLDATSVPVEHIDQLRKLFAEINVDEKNMAVLKRVN
jgi:transglutaminase-like putative cysteine protease